MIIAKNISTRLPILLSIFAVITTSAAFGWLNWNNHTSFEDGKKIREVVLKREQTLQKLMYYDEALSMSAIMSIQTGDPAWTKRYERFLRLYNSNLKEIISVTSSSAPALSSLIKASEKLLDLEEQALALQKEGQTGKSFRLLQSGEYARQKSRYSKAVQSLIKESQKPLNDKIKKMETKNSLSFILSAAVLLFSGCIWLFIIELLRKWRQTVIRVTEEDRHIIQKLKETEASFQKSSERLEMVLKSSSAIIFSVEAGGDFAPLYVSDNITKVLGYSKEEFFGKRWWLDNLHPEDAQHIRSLFPGMYAEGFLTFQFRIRHRDGSWRWMHSDVKVVYDEEQNPIELTGSWWDISKERDIQDAMQAANERLELAFKATRDVLYDTNLKTNQMYFSDELFRSFGYERGLLTDRDWWEEKIHPEDRDELIDSINRAISDSAESWTGHYRFRLADNTYAYIFDRSFIIYNSIGLPHRWIGSMSDITSLKKTESELKTAVRKAEESAKAKSEFLANMSHEIRTPLNGIVGMTDLALDTELTADQKRYLEIVKISCDSLMELINDILDFSKIDAGRLEISRVAFNLRQEMPHLLQPLGLKASHKQLELILNIHPEVPERLFGDVHRIQQVINNLVGNAIKFTEMGNIIVDVKLHALKEQEAVVLFCVSDTGIGISPDKLKMVFAEFTQADASTTRKYGGTGLGLTISRSLVELMGGVIWVESEVRKGSTFSFTVVMGVQEAPEDDSISTLHGLENIRALVVENNLVSSKLMVQMLENFSMKPVAVRSGEEAIAELKKAVYLGQPYPVVVLDIILSGKLDGFDVAKNVKEDAQLNATKIIVVSMSQKASDRSRLALLGVDHYFSKPVSQFDLSDCILNVLSGRNKNLPSNSIQEGSGDSGGLQSLEIYKILLVDDNLVNQEVAGSMLTKRGHLVTVAHDGFEALALYKKEQFDFILMDVQMPVMNGYEATARIRELEKLSGKHTPIIGLTANAMKGDREKCLEAGMDNYISKPVRMNDLFAALKVLYVPESIPQEDLSPRTLTPAVNLIPLMEIIDGDIAILKSILHQYNKSALEQMSALNFHAVNKNIAGIVLSSHSLKGQSMYVEARTVIDLAGKIETLALQNKFEELLPLIPALQSELTVSLNDLKDSGRVLCGEE